MEPVTPQSIGSYGEELARQYLESKNFRFVTANWSCKLGEIDLIMRDNQTLVFVEVRLRRPTSYGEGIDTVGWQKQRKIIRAARFYQQAMDYWKDMRFDVVSITQHPNAGPSIEHIEHAFEAY